MLSMVKLFMKAVYIRFFIFLLATIPGLLQAQIDSVRFENGNLLVGEIKSMEKGVLKMETDYSDSDFLIEWKKVVWLKTQSHFQISLENGSQYYSTVRSVNDSISIIVADYDYLIPRFGDDDTINGQKIALRTEEIVYLNSYNDKFSDRLSAAIDFGIDLAKAKNLKTITTRSMIGYKANKWSSDFTFNTLQTTQDSTDDIRRSDGTFNFRYHLPHKWYLISTLSLLSNSEQKLDMRYNAQQGLGLFIIRTNSAYWGGKLGANRNLERYNNDTEDRDSWEAYIGTELDLYDIGDFSLSLNISAYKGLTETNRYRSDAALDLKYDLPYDLYIRIGTSVNYDTDPAEGASKIDYIFQTGFGWEW